MLTKRVLRVEPSSRSSFVKRPIARRAIWMLLLSVFVACYCASFADAQADGDRSALLIADGNYPDANLPQQSAAKDAALFADELRRDAFDVDLKTDLTRDGMRGAIDAFLGKIKPGSTALLYFNGIGIQVARQTYLIPINAEIWSEADVKREGIGIDGVVADMNRRGAAVKIVVIDASRRNPFERRFRAYSAGLAGLDAPEGTLVMYATAPNKVGPDGTGDVSLFMNELVKELRTPNISAEDAIMHTRVGVSRASNGEQVPWFASSLVDPIYFGRAPDGQPGAPPPAPDKAPPPPPPANVPPPADSASNRTPPPPPPPEEKAPVSPPPPEPPPAPAPADKAPPPPPPPADNTPPPPPPAPVAPPPPKAPEPVVQAPTSPPPAPPAPPPAPPAAPPPPEPTTAAGDAPGTIIKDCPDCPEMMVLGTGSFLMGSGTTPFDRPPHRVSIDKPFAIARTEVTFADWARCVSTGGCTYKPDSQGFGEGLHPVINVSWNDAKDFVAWLSRTTGKVYRLPSEAEWEYAAHGGTNTAFSWGPTVGEHMANCSDCGGNRDAPHTDPVASYPANGYGLFDMAGNAAEWVEDCWNPSYRGAPKDGSAWTTGTCEQRVLRGGSFDSTAAYAKPSARFRYDADVRYWANGFRVLREVP